jgi:RES domain-containing protein
MVGGGRVHDRAILDALEAFDHEALEQTVWRVTRKGRDPLRGAVANGRWNAVGEIEVLYTSVEPDGALAEVGYRLSLEPIWPSKIEHQLHTLSEKAERVLKFSNLSELERLSVDVAKFDKFEYDATQAIAAAAHFLEYDGLMVPSARFHAPTLVLFVDRIQIAPKIVKSEDVDWERWRTKTRQPRLGLPMA